MTKPVTPHDMFDLWQKMVNPGAYPLQSLMFAVPDAKEIEKKIAELEVVEHWLKANLNMLQLTMKTLQYQLAMLKGGEKAQEGFAAMGRQAKAAAGRAGDQAADPSNPAMWAWNMMADAAKTPSPPSTAKKKKKP